MGGWYEIVVFLSDATERAIRRGDAKEAFKWLNVLDLVDSECAAYWREYGWKLITDEKAKQVCGAQRSAASGAVGAGGAQLAHKSRKATTYNPLI